MSVFDAAEERQLVGDLTHVALTEDLPEELEVFETRRDSYLDDRGTIPPQEHGPDDPTGFGAEVVVLLAPYVVAGALAAVRFVGGLFADAVKEETKPQFGKLVRRIFRLDPAPDPPTTGEAVLLAALPADTVARVRDVVRTVCRQHGLPEDDVALVSDAVAGRLALPAA